ncbi:MAG: UDP-glucose 4-epimerase GalE [Hydrogenophaga sp.]|uniref:UDP-glucose 4-epimerase GalE n=1 Tax=Hydrogenophaga sp. TaxID=1904254 RepID=UPI0025C19263|nr:UDP-glucose 4-epimerase GalE [Hydrogenophaga sp.]MBT9552139.1 UDP-glucose 4-epimerase GalE [Hydrogenophaga sp.]
MNVLLTGGCGYIGSHVAVVLMSAGHEVVIVDNLTNSRRDVVDKIAEIGGRPPSFYQGDVGDVEFIRDVIRRHRIDSVIHLAGFKSVGESVQLPLKYYQNNVCGALGLLQAMEAESVSNLVFSSSATIYGNPQYLPVDEAHPQHVINAYGRSKLHIEEMLRDVCISRPSLGAICLRYFNPVGAHHSGLIGDHPRGIPNNLMPYVVQVASGEREFLNVFGGDYPTPDGTGVRDYIHVMDLAEGHVAALNHLSLSTGWHAFNLGTGKGYSVLEMIRAFEGGSGRAVPYKITARREGDVACAYADIQAATLGLNWKAKRTLEDMCSSAWFFQNHLSTRRQGSGR